MAVDPRERAKKIEFILGEPDLYPDAFKAYLPRAIELNPNFVLAPTALPPVETINYVGASGNALFVGTWVNYEAGYEAAGYYKDPFGRVHIAGVVKNGVSGSVIFNLPAGYRPKGREQFVSWADGAPLRIDVAANGDVIHFAGGVGFVSLSPIDFRAYS
jgi:hypothetical protein